MNASRVPANSARGGTTQRLVVVSAGASDPSATRMLADRIAERVVAIAGQRCCTV
jgi:FMN reductase